MLTPLTYFAVMFAVAAYAFGRGKLDERLAASICVIGSAATLFLGRQEVGYFADMEIGIAIVDILALVGFILLALWSNRFWPLWVAGFQLTSVLSHFIKAAHWELIPEVYAAAERFWIYPIFLAIVVGTWRSRRRWRSEQPHRVQPV